MRDEDFMDALRLAHRLKFEDGGAAPDTNAVEGEHDDILSLANRMHKEASDDILSALRLGQASPSAGEGMDGLPPEMTQALREVDRERDREPVLKEYRPSLKERIAAYLMGDERPSPERRQLARGVADLSYYLPGVGEAIAGDTLGRSAAQGDTWPALKAAAGALPGVGKLAGAAAQKALPLSHFAQGGEVGDALRLAHRMHREDGGGTSSDASREAFLKEQLQGSAPQYVEQNDVPARISGAVEGADRSLGALNNALASGLGASDEFKNPMNRSAREIISQGVSAVMPSDPNETMKQAQQQWSEGDRLGAATTAALGMPGTGMFVGPSDKAARMARAVEQGFEGPWYHGSSRIDRVVEKPGLDPKRATSGPMPYFTNNPELASKYAEGKADTSLMDEGDVSKYFTVHPKHLGWSGRSEIPVEQSWLSLAPEHRQEILRRAKRVGYANPEEASGPLMLHPEGQEAILSPSHYDWVLKNEARGNPLRALRDIWHDSGELIHDPGQLEEVFRLAGYPHPISQKSAPWTEARGILPVMLRLQNPLRTANTDELTGKVIPHLEEAFKRDRTRRADYGADSWDKNYRYTPRDWVAQLREDLGKGDNSYVWTSIPDKVTNQFKTLGYDSILDLGGKGGTELHDVAVPFYPHQVRSIFAQFDPKHLESSNILKSHGGEVSDALRLAHTPNRKE